MLQVTLEWGTMQEVQQSLSLAGSPLAVRFRCATPVTRLFDQSVWHPWGSLSASLGPGAAGRVYRGDHHVVEAASPGLDSEAIEIEMVQGTLTMRSTHPEATTDGRHYLMPQWPRGQFQAAVARPDAGDGSQVSSSYEQGRLRWTVPRSEAAKPKRIMLKAGAYQDLRWHLDKLLTDVRIYTAFCFRHAYIIRHHTIVMRL
jgi:HSP20 family protein